MCLTVYRSLEAAHSRVGECPSSSDSESSSRSESDSESIAEEQLHLPVNSSVKTEVNNLFIFLLSSIFFFVLPLKKKHCLFVSLA